MRKKEGAEAGESKKRKETKLTHHCTNPKASPTPVLTSAPIHPNLDIQDPDLRATEGKERN